MIIALHAVTSRRNMLPRAVTFLAEETESWPGRIMKTAPFSVLNLLAALRPECLDSGQWSGVWA